MIFLDPGAGTKYYQSGHALPSVREVFLVGKFCLSPS